MAGERSIWSRILAFFAENPIFGVLGSLCSIAAIPLALWLSIKEPRLTFSVQPGRLEVVRVSQASGISVRYKGHPVSGDVSAAKVALWNAGDAPIRERDDVRKGVVIFLKPAASILKAVVVRAEPLEARVTVDPTQFEHGRLPVHWDVLAKGEGAVFEILYNGSPDVSFGVEGSVLGQREIAKYSNEIGYDSPEAEYRDLRRVNENWQFVGPFFAIVTIIGSGVTGLMAVKEKDKFKRKLWIALAGLTLSASILFVIGYYVARSPDPKIGSHAHGPIIRKKAR